MPDDCSSLSTEAQTSDCASFHQQDPSPANTMMRTVLLVADCEYTAVPLEIALTCLDKMRVLRASNASEASEILFRSNQQITALITDLYLPQVDSLQLIAQVRRVYPLIHLPILVVTSDDHPDTPSRLFRLGADAYFLKPFSPTAVRQKLHSLLEMRSQC